MTSAVATCINSDRQIHISKTKTTIIEQNGDISLIKATIKIQLTIYDSHNLNNQKFMIRL